jgi:hypothetical protein
MDFVIDARIRKGEVSVQFECKFVKLMAGDLLVERHLENPIVVRESLWHFEDLPLSSTSRILRLVLIKSRPGVTWTRVFAEQSGCLDPIEEEEARKAILLERFSQENPDFDFSQARFEGTGIPDARSFMRGLTL